MKLIRLTRANARSVVSHPLRVISRTPSLAQLAGLCIAVATTGAHASFSATYLGAGATQTHGAAYSAGLAWDSLASVNYYNLAFAEHRWDLGAGAEVAWCVQLFQGLTVGNAYSFDAVALELAPQAPPAPGPMGITKATIMRDAMSRWLTADSRVIASAGSSNASAAAFAALVWEISHENLASSDLSVALARMSLQTGAFRSNLAGESATIYAAMVGSLGVGGWQFAQAEGWINSSAQDQCRLVPAPASGALLLLGALVRGARRRRS